MSAERRCPTSSLATDEPPRDEARFRLPLRAARPHLLDGDDAPIPVFAVGETVSDR